MTSEQQPVAFHEYVIALLLAGHCVTQEKVDEARAIALGVQPGPMSPPATIPTAAVEALVEMLRTGGTDARPDDPYLQGMWDARQQCADELAQLIPEKPHG